MKYLCEKEGYKNCPDNSGLSVRFKQDRVSA